MSEEKKALLAKVRKLTAVLEAAKKLNIKGLGKGKPKEESGKG